MAGVQEELEDISSSDSTFYEGTDPHRMSSDTDSEMQVLEVEEGRARSQSSPPALQAQNIQEVEVDGSPEIGRRRRRIVERDPWGAVLSRAFQDPASSTDEEESTRPQSEASGVSTEQQTTSTPPAHLPWGEPAPDPPSPELFDNPQPQPASPPPLMPLDPRPPQERVAHSSSSEPQQVWAPPSPPAVAGPSAPPVPAEVTPKKTAPVAAPVQHSPESEDEGQICSICFEPWGNLGEHRLSSLRCGHLFGFECISKWLKGKNGRCPQCNAKATRKEIRIIYAKALKVLDTSEKERILQELEKEREDKRRLEVEHAQTKLKYELKAQLVVKLQEELKVLRTLVARPSSSQGLASSQGGDPSNQGKMRLSFSDWLEVCREGGCRVMAYNEWLCMLVVSMPSQVNMFPGCGVKKINMLDLRVDRYIPLHQKQIRDMAFNPVKHDLLLSVGMDKIIKITNICTITNVASFTAASPLWSCCWSTSEANKFFVGTTAGRVEQYDVRDLTGPVVTIELPGSGPAVSMTYVPRCLGAPLSRDGFLVARLQSCCFVEPQQDGTKSHQLPLEGPFNSVSCEVTTGHMLVSCRPTQRHPHTRHIVCQLREVVLNNDNLAEERRAVTTHPVHTFQGGTTQKVLMRSVLARSPYQEGNLLIYASDESTQSTYVWDLASTSCLHQLRHADTVIDLLPVSFNQTHYLATLNEKGVRLYKWHNL